MTVVRGWQAHVCHAMLYILCVVLVREEKRERESVCETLCL